MPGMQPALVTRFAALIALTFLTFSVALYFLILWPMTAHPGQSEMLRAALDPNLFTFVAKTVNDYDFAATLENLRAADASKLNTGG